MASAGAESFGASVADKAISTYMDNVSRKNLMAAQEHSDKRLAVFNQNLEIERDQRRLSDLVNGAQRAGFSPLAVLGSGFSAPTSAGASVSVPSGSSHDASAVANALAQRMQDEQFEVMNKEKTLLDEKAETERTQQRKNISEAGNKDVDTSDKQIEVNRKLNEDDTIHRNLTDMFTRLRDNAKSEDERKRYQKVLDETGKFTAGALRGLQSYTDYDFRLLQQDLERRIIQAKKDENAPKSLALIPSAELAKLLTEKAKMYSEIASMSQSRQLDEAKINEIEAKIKVLEREEQSIYHNDPVAMYNADNGDWSTYMLTNGIRDIVHGVGQGVGYGGAAAVTRRLDPAAPKDLKKLSDSPKTPSSLPSQKLSDSPKTPSSLPSQSVKQRNERIRKSVEQREQKRREHQRKGSEIRKRMNSPFPDFYYAQ